MGILLPDGIFFFRQALHVRRQGRKTFPEPRMRLAGHGNCSSRPARISARTSSNTTRSRPSSEKSASICRSQVWASQSAIKAESSANSIGERLRTACLISATLILLKMILPCSIASCHRRPSNRLTSQPVTLSPCHCEESTGRRGNPFPIINSPLYGDKAFTASPPFRFELAVYCPQNGSSEVS